MGLKKDLKALTKFSDNPFEADYRPEKEMKRLFIGLQLSLPIFLGFCCQFYILVAGPLFIYWIVIFAKGREYWKDLGWKMRWYYIPTIFMTALGLFLAIQQYLVTGLFWLINNFMLYT